LNFRQVLRVLYLNIAAGRVKFSAHLLKARPSCKDLLLYIIWSTGVHNTSPWIWGASWTPGTSLVSYNSTRRHDTSRWRWRQHGTSKRWYITTTLHIITTQKTSTWNITALKALNVSLKRF